MLTLSGLIFLILIAIGVALWQTNARARELANHTSKKVCAQQNLQFLDGTTILDRFHIKRADSGLLGIIRHYHFEFYNGSERLKGHITIFKNEVIELYLETPLPDLHKREQRDLFDSANETSNIIQFPKKR